MLSTLPEINSDSPIADRQGPGLQDDQVIRYLDAIARGEFDVGIQEDGGIANALRRLCDHLQARARSELEATTKLSINASEAMSAVSFMVGDVRESDQRSQMMAAATEEMTVAVNGIAASSEDVAAKSTESSATAANGIRRIEQAISGMEGIGTNVAAIGDRVDKASASSEEIASILKTIDDIAAQTNLLALNATIEAARAGEHGKGFAVVAGEVKALSRQTATATEDIRAKIGTLSNEMSALTTAMETCRETVNTGKDILDEAGGDVRSIGSEVAMVSERISEISNNISEQSIAVREIGEGLSGISKVTERNNRNSRHTALAVSAIESYVTGRFEALDQIHIENSILYRAKSDHAIWKKKLAEMLAGLTRLSGGELSDHHQCRLGKWYDQVTDQAVTSQKAFIALAGPHKEVHKHGLDTARLFAEGNMVEAKVAFDKMDAASHDVIAHLDELIGSQLPG